MKRQAVQGGLAFVVALGASAAGCGLDRRGTEFADGLVVHEASADGGAGRSADVREDASSPGDAPAEVRQEVGPAPPGRDTPEPDASLEGTFPEGGDSAGDDAASAEASSSGDLGAAEASVAPSARGRYHRNAHVVR